MQYSTIVDTNNNGPDTPDEVLTESWTDGAGRVRQSRTPHTFNSNGSTATWAATTVDYDILGRVLRQSVPTEVNSSWAATGDDLSRGFIYNYTFYDWKGRTTRTVPSDSNGTDGKDTLISYAGCGCAGGQETTIEGPTVPRTDTSGNARRKQKSYDDILGRSLRTESFEWDGVTAYNTTVNLFNGRDQVINSRTYAGTTSSSTYRDTVMTYDGHGRLASEHLPRQANSPAKVYSYFADDSVASITDARGATKNLTYNSRGLTSQISWSVPAESGISVPHEVTFAYDNVGNRTEMDDGFGTVTYSYNSLSRATSETRNFNYTVPSAPLNNNGFAIGYSYELSGDLASVTTPYGNVINYRHDKIGRLNTLSEVQGSSTYDYEANTTYRAWGAVKRQSVNNAQQYQEYTYDSALRPADYKFAVTGGADIAYLSYQYANDGKVKFSSPSTNSIFDRSYEYDQVGRLIAGRTGAEARGSIETNSSNRPYRETFGYNAFDDPISKNRLHWKATYNSDFSYTGARQTSAEYTSAIAGWGSDGQTIQSTFDADGRETDHLVYDADGRLAANSDPPVEYEHGMDDRFEWLSETFAYDGLGNIIRRVQTCAVSCYSLMREHAYIHSTLLDKDVEEIQYSGSVVSERKTNIYDGKSRVAQHFDGGNKQSTFYDPSGANLVVANSAPSAGASKEEIDPIGAGVGSSDTYPAPPDPFNGEDCNWNDYDDFECDAGMQYDDPDVEDNAGSIPRNTFYMDGVPIRSEDAEHLMEIGAVKIEAVSGMARSSMVQNPIYGTRYSPIEKNHDDPSDVIRIHTDLEKEEYISGWETTFVTVWGGELSQVRVADCSNDNAVGAFPFVNSAILDDFNKAMSAVNKGIGAIGFTEMFRPTEHQTELYNQRQNDIKTWEKSYRPTWMHNSKPLPVADPGTSSHEAGYSFDVPIALLEGSRGGQLINILAGNGFVRDVMTGQPLGDIYGDDKVHFTHKSWGEMSEEQRRKAIADAQAAFAETGLPKQPGTAMQAPKAKRPECN